MKIITGFLVVVLFASGFAIAGIKTPYGDYDHHMSILTSQGSQVAKRNSLGQMTSIIPWLARNGHEDRADSAYDQILEMARTEKDFLTRKKALSEIWYMLYSHYCKKTAYVDKAMVLAKQVVVRDSSPEVRMKGIDLVSQVAKCRKNPADNSYMEIMLKIISRDTNPEVLDRAAKSLVWIKGDGYKTPEKARGVIIKSVRRFLLLQNPDAAWAIFPRSPFKFQSLPELHDELLEGPVPSKPWVLHFALRSLDDSILDLLEKKGTGQQIVRIRYMKYRLYMSAMGETRRKLIQANRDYNRIYRKRDKGMSKLPLGDFLRRQREIWKKQGIGGDVREGVILGVEKEGYKEISRRYKRDDGIEGVLARIGEHTRPGVEKNSRLLAWQMLAATRTKKAARLPESLVVRLEGYYKAEKDADVRKAAKEFFSKERSR